MMRASLMMTLLTAAASAAQSTPVNPDAPKRIRLARQSTAKQVGAFHYRLLPDPIDRTPGNAAPLWRLAGDAFRGANHKMTVQESDWAGIPLKDLPRKEVREFLDHYRAALRVARQAACRDHCDWEIPPLTLQSIEESVSLVNVQKCRELAQLLSIRYRLALVEGRFEEAAETLQTGFALARHLCESDMMIQNLVGIAIAAIMFGRVEEWMQTPGSPNLYWALTALPRPFGDVRRSFEHELNMFYRSFPSLRRLRRKTLTERQADELAKEVFDTLSKILAKGAQPNKAEEIRKVGESICKAEQYPQARQHLLDLGRPAKEIDAMPKVQVVLLWHLDQYDRVRDDVLKTLVLPVWQARPLDEAIERFGVGNENAPPLLDSLMPALLKTRWASVRLERQLAGLRCAEALRLYAATHKGKVLAKWSDITAVPLPIDPVTGKGFDEFYEVKDGRAILEAPAPPGQPGLVGRRYELPLPVDPKKER